MARFIQDVRYAWRRLHRQPGFAGITVLMLGLGVGSVATLFSIFNGVILRSVNVPDADRLIGIARVNERGQPGGISYPDFLDVAAAGGDVFERSAVFRNWQGAFSANGRAETLLGEVVSGEYFSTLGLVPARGRLLDRTDDDPASRAVVISHTLWQSRFDGSDAAMGAAVKIAGRPFTIVGVAPASFHGLTAPTLLRAEVWIPLQAGVDGRITVPREALGMRNVSMVRAFARLRPGSPPERAEAFLQTVAARLQDEWRRLNMPPQSLATTPFRRVVMPESFEIGGFSIGGAILGLALLVLAAACANLAQLALAQNAARAPELAIRAATGADRWHLFRLLLTDTGLIVVLAGAAGLLLSYAMASALSLVTLPGLEGMPIAVSVRPDVRVFGFALAVIALTIAATGLVPAWRVSRVSVNIATASAGGTGGATSRGRLRTALVASQVAVSVTLLLVAGLLVRSARDVLRFDRGFETGREAVLRVDLASQGYDEPRGRALFTRLLEDASRLPGVDSAALFDRFPVTTGGGASVDLIVDGTASVTATSSVAARHLVGSPDLFRTIGLPMRAGRVFTLADVAGAPNVAIVTPAVAEKFWPRQNPIGRRMAFTQEGSPDRWVEIVGVTADVHVPSRPTPRLVWTPAAQTYRPAMGVVVRTSADPHVAADQLREALRRIDDGLAPMESMTLAEYVRDVHVLVQISGAVMLALAFVAGLIAAVGLYAVVAHYVSMRRREIGIRIALGATSRDVHQMIQRQALRYLAVGVVPGALAALAIGQLIRGTVLGIRPFDAVTFVVVPLLLLLVGLTAAWQPARRAARLDPLVALRSL